MAWESTVRRGCQVLTDPGNRGAWSCDHSDTVIQSGAVNSANFDRKSKWGQFKWTQHVNSAIANESVRYMVKRNHVEKYRNIKKYLNIT